MISEEFNMDFFNFNGPKFYFMQLLNIHAHNFDGVTHNNLQTVCKISTITDVLVYNMVAKKILRLSSEMDTQKK